MLPKNNCQKKNVSSKNDSDFAETTSLGRLYQIRGAVAEKGRENPTDKRNLEITGRAAFRVRPSGL